MTLEAGIEAHLHHDGDESEHSHDDSDNAIPVKLVGTESKTPELASFQTYVFAGNEAPFQVLPQTKRRHRAIILVFGNAGNSVKIGRFTQMANNQGAAIPAPNTIVYEAGAAIWVQPQGQAVSMSIVDEWYTE